MNSIYYFDIDDELLTKVKEDINLGIEDILRSMTEKDVLCGELKLSLKITLSEENVISAAGNEKNILVPTIEHKTSNYMTIKKESKGVVDGYCHGGNGMLALTKLGGKFAAVRTPKDGSQLTLDDQRLYAGLSEDKSNA